MISHLGAMISVVTGALLARRFRGITGTVGADVHRRWRHLHRRVSRGAESGGGGEAAAGAGGGEQPVRLLDAEQLASLPAAIWWTKRSATASRGIPSMAPTSSACLRRDRRRGGARPRRAAGRSSSSRRCCGWSATASTTTREYIDPVAAASRRSAAIACELAEEAGRARRMGRCGHAASTGARRRTSRWRKRSPPRCAKPRPIRTRKTGARSPPASSADGFARRMITYLEAIREAQARALADDPRVFIYGQDVGAFGGAFKATKNLAQEFPGRVLDSPISEDAMVGSAIGAAIEGMRPIIEMQFADFSTVGFNQIVNQAATLYWRTQVPCPITIRLPCGGTPGGGPFHSQSMEALYAHYPGLDRDDARHGGRRLLACCWKPSRSMTRSSSASTSISITISRRRRCRPKRCPPARRASRARAATPPSWPTAPWSTRRSPARKNSRAKAGRSKSSICARSSRSIPTPCSPRVARTGRLLAVGEAWPWGGVTAEVIARVASEGFGLLDAPPQRLNAKDTPVPYHPNLWGTHRPTARTICRRHAQSFARLDKPAPCPAFPSSCRSSANRSPRPPSWRSPSRSATSSSGDQDIIEVETNKATMGVTAPCHGRVAELLVELQQSYPVGATLGYLEVERRGSRARSGSMPQPRARRRRHRRRKRHAARATHAPRKAAACEPTVRGLPVPAHAAGASYMSPRMKARMHELGLHAADLAGIAGSGAAGRVTVEDFEKFLDQARGAQAQPASSMRVAVADAMRRSWTRPLATVGMPVVLDAAARAPQSEQPQARPRALRPARAGHRARRKQRAGGPARRRQDRASAGHRSSASPWKPRTACSCPCCAMPTRPRSRELVVRYNELVELARQRRLPPDATGGSIATVTNFGTFGLEWATPIPLPEQTLVLGHGRRPRRAALGQGDREQFVPRHRGATHAQLRSPRARWRRRRAAAFADRRARPEARRTVS